MAALRLTAHGKQVLADWLPTAAREDAELVARVLETAADGSWKTRWYWTPDAEDRHVKLIQPRDGLFVAVKFLHDDLPDDPDTFDLLRIVLSMDRVDARD